MTDEAIKAALREATVYRVQDRSGRGPFRPGLTDQWRDVEGADYPPIQLDFGMTWRTEVPPGWHCGCALSDVAAVARWFTASECQRLHILGFNLVSIRARVLRESPHQLLVVRPLPLRFQAIVQPWPLRAEAALSPWREHVARAAQEARE
jgi:hypothetical protein